MDKPKGRILCVDDDKDTRDLMAVLLGLEGYEVVQARNVAEGLALAVSDNFSLILLDWVFADGTGVELCKMIRRSSAAAPILFYSGMALKDDIENALSAGAQGFLVKPVDVEVLLQNVLRFVDNDCSITTVS
ncbi:MAG TPA: response regulator [Blastocatellia bacterium]|nr:response regulator [Blastocatellia bacterium]